jgi:hypothetical protein
MANSKRKCKYCGVSTKEFIVVNMSAFCTFDEAVQYANENKAKGAAIIKKANDKKHTKKKKELKDNDKSFRDKQAQSAFNAYIRARDADYNCISCGRNHSGQYHAGHFRSRGAHPELRFEELNCHKQCAPCNNHLSGNISNYRPALIAKIGQNKVDWIEGPHEIVKYTCADLKAIELKYKSKLKQLTGE